MPLPRGNATRGRPCSICSNPAARAAVDGQLLRGITVAKVIELFAGTFELSPAAIYRHARHMHDRHNALSVPLPDGEAPADQIRLLVETQRVQYDILARAEKMHDDRLAASATDRLRSTVHELALLTGLDAQYVVEEMDSFSKFIRALWRVGYDRPDLARELATEMSRHRHAGFAESLIELAEFGEAEGLNKKEESA